MSNFFSEELKIADEKTAKAMWLGRENGIYFRCGFCGFKLNVGDKYRLIYTNDISGASGNPIVCEKCNDSTENLRQKWKKKSDIAYSEYWWFTRK